MNQFIKHSLIFILCLSIIPSCASKKKLKKSANKDTETKENISVAPKITEPILLDNTNTDTEAIYTLIQSNATDIEELVARINYLQETVYSYQTGEALWNEPLSMYEKKIILNNGTTFYGNVIYQDQESVHIETLIGTLALERNSIIRVVDHESSLVDYDSQLENFNLTKHTDTDDPNAYSVSAKVVLLGDFIETTDENKNVILTGQVKNIGSKRADFTSITFTIYSENSTDNDNEEFTAFISGSSINFSNGITSNSSLNNNEVGLFSVLVPKELIPFTSYTYDIDWEQYD